jgi:predicted Zn-dependent peptidase
MKQKEAIVLSQQPSFYWIPLPQNEKRIYFSLIFPLQADINLFNEIHLLEHYLMNLFVKSLRKENIKQEGRIDLQTLEFHFVFPESKFEKYVQKIFDILNSVDFTQSEILEHEKEVLLSEIPLNNRDFVAEIASKIKKTKTLQNIPYFLIDFDNVQKIKKLNLNDLKNIFQKVILDNSPYIFFGSQNKSAANKIKKEVINNSLWLNWKKIKKKIDFPKQTPPQFRGLKIQKIFSKKAPAYKNYFIYLFRGLSLKNHFSQRMILEICSRIIFSHPQSDFRKYLRDKFGIYEIEFKNVFYPISGFSFLSFWVTREKALMLIDFIRKDFDWEMVDWKKIFSLWRKEQKEIFKNANSDWQINSKRFQWIVEDLVLEKRVISPRLYKDVFEKTKLKTIKKVFSRTFDFKNCYLWIVSFK